MADERGGPPSAPEAWWARPPSTAAVPKPDPERPVARAARPSAVPPRPPVRQSRPPFGDQRGLTTAGATILVLALSGLGAGVDVVTGTGLRTVFAVAFTVAAALAAATVHHEDLLASVVIVPLCFAAVGLVSGIAEGSGLQGLSKIALGIANVMVTAAPALLLATAAAAVIASLRAYAVRRRRRTPWRSAAAG
ncbi:MAG: DUF6542 domain-containing protein [Actinomycetes bacterium]